jgi:TonB family protein
MIASWMLYTLVMSVLITVMAIGLERVGMTLRRPVRLIWVASIAASLIAPAVALAWSTVSREKASVQLMPFVIDVQRANPITANGSRRGWGVSLDMLLAAAWALGTVALLTRLAREARSLRRRRRSWRQGEVDGVDVHLAPDAGPAVVGVRSMSVVLPEWIFDLDRPLRAMVLRHEEEHRTARDPYLLFGAAVAVALMPWNVALWLQARRLRLAIELDCDARVLKADPRPERYGLLLLAIAQRRSFAPTMLAPMLSEPASHLERRIMVMRRTRIAQWSIATGAALSVLALGFACTLQSPDNVTGPRQAPQRVSEKQTFFEFQVEQEAKLVAGGTAPRYPTALRAAKVEGEVLAQFVVNQEGRVDTASFKALKSTDPMFTATVRSSLTELKFTPARVGDKAVKQLVQMPFVFNLSQETATAGAAIRPEGPESQVRAVRHAPEANVAPRDERAESQEKKYVGPPNAGDIYFEYQVQKPVQPRPENRAPRYPDALRAARVEGEVLAQFVVDRNGEPELSTFKVLKATDPRFVEAVKSALADMLFYPGEISGQHVRQLVQMPFQFNLSTR